MLPLPALGALGALAWGVYYLTKGDDKKPTGTTTSPSAVAPIAPLGTMMVAPNVPHPVTGAPVGRPLPGLPIVGPKAPTMITPAGKPQPPSIVISQPPMPTEVVSSALHDAAAHLIQLGERQSLKTTVSDATVLAFQKAYNANRPPVALALDGKYGPKCQAALQSVVSPAVAPVPNAPPGMPIAVVAAPTGGVAAANPALVNNVLEAGNNLARYFAGTGKKGSFGPVTTFQTAWNQHRSNKPLVVDGKYGPSGEAALQAVFNWSASDAGGPPNAAPKNAYGARIPVPVFVP